MRATVLLLLLALAAPAAADEFKPERKKPSADLPLGQSYEWQSKAKRPYWYRLPAAVDAADPPNLIVMCHGTGLNYKWSFWNYPIAKLTWRPHDIVVSPESETPGRGFMQKKSDRDDVADLIKTFKKAFPIANVYLYGHSQGGFFAYYFAGEKPELVDGVIGHAGNFFKCKTNKKARDTVAIGILHGRADAVVTVDCAFMTDLVYRKAGYAHVKLFVVEGLTAQSGHWPLPWHVNELLEWQDTVHVKSAAAAVRIAEREIKKEKPVAARLLAACTAAVRLGADAPEALKGKVAALGALRDAARDAHAKAVAAYPADAEYGPWAAHVRWARRAFAGDDAWAAATPGFEKLAAKHTKALAKAKKALFSKNKKTMGTLLKALENGFLGDGYDRVLLHAGRLDEKPNGLVGPKEAARFQALQKARAAADKQGLETAAAILKPLLDDYRAKG